MNTAYHPTFGPNGSDVRRVNRAITWSIAVHVLLVLIAAVLPRDWFAAEESHVMTVSLGGTPGPRSTGETSIGGRTVEEVAPPPPRPEPVRPVPPQPPTPEAPAVRTPPRTETPAPAATRPPRPTERPPVTGRQVARGSTPVDTGATGEGAGLSFGGDQGLGGVTDVGDFCCQWYLDNMVTTIQSNWRSNQSERGGTTVLRFVIRRNGQIDDVQVEQSSGNGILDRAARAALSQTRLPSLPGEYTEQSLIIHLRFPYGSQ